MERKADPDCSCPQEVSELREKLKDRKANGPRFPQRLLLSLQLTQKNDQFVPFVGVKWVSQTEFACNAEIFGKTINIKPNSVNKQFSAFTFDKIEKSDRSSLESLPLSGNWIIRSCRNPLFNASMTYFDAGLIESVKDGQKSGPEISVIVDSFISQFPNANAIKALFDESGKKIPELEQCIAEWKNIVSAAQGNLQTHNISKIIQNFANPPITDSSLHFFISELMEKNKFSSVVMQDMGFLDYYRLFLRFGSIYRIAHSIFSLINTQEYKFYVWFKPSEAYTDDGNEPFYVKLSSSSPSDFTLKASQLNRKIKCKPLADPSEMFECDGIKSSSIFQLIKDLGVVIPEYQDGQDIPEPANDQWGGSLTFSFFSQSGQGI